MGLHEYIYSKKLEREDVPFYALIMAAMRRADTYNLARLKMCWPDVWLELEGRYHAPGGLLPNDPERKATCQECGGSVLAFDDHGDPIFDHRDRCHTGGTNHADREEPIDG